MEINKIYCIDNIKGMIQLGAETVDLTVTSPPYDDMRNYKGYSFDFERVARGLLYVTKLGGTVVWVVADATKNGNETGTSFKQALYFKEIGFNLHDTMIYHKKAVGASGSSWSYNQSFEYMFVFTKGKIKTFNPIKDLIPDRAGKPTKYTKHPKSNKDGYSTETVTKIAPNASKRQNLWTYDIGFGSQDDKTSHPAVFPEKLAEDHILSWSNEGDLVFDPFSGSGTTAKMAMLNKRNFIGFDSSQEYVELSNNRLALYR
jgi:site-specific DNA-methyltransferase (adenine-specific)